MNVNSLRIGRRAARLAVRHSKIAPRCRKLVGHEEPVDKLLQAHGLQDEPDVFYRQFAATRLWLNCMVFS
jgi:hypothetical protein